MAACDSCADLALLLNSGGLSLSGGGSSASSGGCGSHHSRCDLSLMEFSAIEKQVSAWPSRYCSCCFNDLANFEKFNSLLQRILAKAIKFLETLVSDVRREKRRVLKLQNRRLRLQRSADGIKTKEGGGGEMKETEGETKDGVGVESGEDSKDANEDDDDDEGNVEGDEDEEAKCWPLDERQRLLQFVPKIFQASRFIFMRWLRGCPSVSRYAGRKACNAKN